MIMDVHKVNDLMGVLEIDWQQK